MLKTLVTKLTSARFLLAIMFGITLCYLVKVEPSVRDAFFALAGGLLRDYFAKNRPEEKTNGNG